jgi:ParB family chromosome partitioning protein
MTEVIEGAAAADQESTPVQATREPRIVRVQHHSCFVSKFNPRKQINKLYIAFLAGSIRAQGILQRPMAREVEIDGVPMYELIFGQCRFLANQMNYGPEGYIELDIREMSDEQVALAAQTENTVRVSMTPVEEAEGAAVLLATFHGDREMTAKELGWARAKLDTMLKLMACSESVRQQLVTAADPLGKMPIGVAELLAGLPYAQQDKCMEAFIRRGGFPTIDALKAEIQQLSKTLAAAIFDKTDCAQCPHNSAQQRAMFETGLDDGYCLKGACYEEKTEAELVMRHDKLTDDYQVVKILRPGDNFSVVKVVIDGDAGVGSEQALACRSCSNFGAAVSAFPDKIGNIARALCFDLACNEKMQLAHKASVAELAKAQSDEQAAAEEQSQGGDGGGSDSGAASETSEKGPQTAGTNKAAPTVPTVTLTSGVLEYRDKLYRTVIAKEIAAVPERGYAMLIALAASRRLSAIPDETMIGVLQKHGGDGVRTGALGTNFSCALALESGKLAAFVSKMGATCADNLQREELVVMIKELKPDWKVHFTLGEDFFKVLTKSEIQAVAIDVGLDKALAKEFKSLFAKKKDEIITALAAVKDFDYCGALPKVLKPNFNKR